MTAKIFRNSMVVGLSVFLLTVALFMSMLYQYFQEQFTAQLENEAALVSAGVEAMGQDYLDGLSSTSRLVSVRTWYDNALTGVQIAFALLTLAGAAMYIRAAKRKKS